MVLPGKQSLERPNIQFLAFGKLGLVLVVLSAAVVALVTYFFPDIDAYFGVNLLGTNFYVNLAMRFYAGFLASSALTLAAQFILWILVISSALTQEEYNNYLGDVKTIRNFSVYALGILFLLLFLISGKSLPKG